ncbi:hypothetical protein KRR40_01995 [Niabella defluvii]|nr:hypothetical protein KRR40_01995 [Niabella sp. I65]
MEEVMKDWGPNDLTKVGAIWYGTDYNSFKMMPYAEEENVWISKLPPAKLEQVKRNTTGLEMRYMFAILMHVLQEILSTKSTGRLKHWAEKTKKR